MAKAKSQGSVRVLVPENLGESLRELARYERLLVLFKWRIVPWTIGGGVIALGILALNATSFLPHVVPWPLFVLAMSLLANRASQATGYHDLDVLITRGEVERALADHRVVMLRFVRKLIEDFDTSVFSAVHDDAVRSPEEWAAHRDRHLAQVQLVVDHVADVMERDGDLGDAHDEGGLVDDAFYEVVETYVRRIEERKVRARLEAAARREVKSI